MPEQTPIWKREIRLGRRRAAPPPPGRESEAPTVAGDAGRKVDAAALEPPVETPVTPSEALAVTVDPVPAASAEPAPAVAVEPADKAPVAASSPAAVGPAVTVVSGPDPVEAGPEARPAPAPAPVPVNGVVSLPQPTAGRAGLLTEEEQFCPDVDRALMPRTEDEQLAQLDALLAQLNSRQLLTTRPPTSVAPQSATSPRGEPHADLVVHPAEPIATADPVPLPVPEPAQPLPPAAAEPVPPAGPEPVPAVDVGPASTAEPEPVPAPQAEVVAPESEAEADVVAPEPEPQVAVPASEDAVATEARSSLLRREIHFGRPRLPRLARKRKTEKPAVESLPPAVARLLEPEREPEREPEVIVAPEPAPANEVEAALMADLADALAFELEPDGVAPEPEPQVAVPAPERAVEPQAKRSLVRREFSFGRPRLPRLARNLKAARPAAESLKAASAKLAAWWRSTQIRLRKGKSLRLPSLRLRLTLPFELPFGAGREQTATASGASTIVGLRVGSSQLAAALVHNNGSAELAQLARTPLERGIVVGGEVRDPTALARALKVFFAEHKLPHKGVRLGIANNRIGVRVLDVPAVKDPNLMANAIRFRAQEVMPFPMAEAVLDQVVLGDPIGKGLESTQKVLIVFAHRNLVDRYVEACSAAGLKLVGIDFDAFALLRAVSDVRREDEEAKAAVIAVALGQERTIFAVSDGRICDFARVLEWGGGALDSALADALELSPLEAQQLKQTLSLTGSSGHPELSDEQLEKARAVLRQELQVLARELVTSLQFYQSRPESLDIGEVLLSGGGAELVGIDAELGRMLGVPVRVADPLARVTLSGDVRRPAEPGSLAIAIGLGIEEQH